MVYFTVGLLAALLVGAVARVRSPLTYFVTVILAMIGAWFFASILRFEVSNDIKIAGVSIIEASIGAVLFALIGTLIFYRRREVVIESN